MAKYFLCLLCNEMHIAESSHYFFNTSGLLKYFSTVSNELCRQMAYRSLKRTEGTEVYTAYSSSHGLPL